MAPADQPYGDRNGGVEDALEIYGSWQPRFRDPRVGSDSSAIGRRIARVVYDAGDLSIDPDDDGIRPENISLGWRDVFFTHLGERFLAFGRLFAGVC